LAKNLKLEGKTPQLIGKFWKYFWPFKIEKIAKGTTHELFTPLKKCEIRGQKPLKSPQNPLKLAKNLKLEGKTPQKHPN